MKLGNPLISFRLETEKKKKLDEIAKARGMPRTEIMRDAVKEYLALYIMGSEPTVGRVWKRVEILEARMTKIENLLLKGGVENVKANTRKS